MKSKIIAGSIIGVLIIIGEGILNGAILKEQWDIVNAQLHLAPPSNLVISLALTKLFVLGFVLIWLYEIFKYKYGQGNTAALASGLTIGLLIWGWVLAGMWLAGYINNHIGIVTFFWGLVEIPAATIAGVKVYEKMLAT